MSTDQGWIHGLGVGVGVTLAPRNAKPCCAHEPATVGSDLVAGVVSSTGDVRNTNVRNTNVHNTH